MRFVYEKIAIALGLSHHVVTLQLFVRHRIDAVPLKQDAQMSEYSLVPVWKVGEANIWCVVTAVLADIHVEQGPGDVTLHGIRWFP